MPSRPLQTEPRHVYIDCTWADSFPPPRVVKFRSRKPWQWHTWFGGEWPRKALIFGQGSTPSQALKEKEAEWLANRTFGQVKVFTETRVGTVDAAGVASLERLLLEETTAIDYVVVKINMQGLERHLFAWLAGTVAFDLIDAIYYEDSHGGIVPGLETFRKRGALVSHMKVDGSSDILFNLHPDRYHACKQLNREFHLGDFTSNDSMSFQRGGHSGKEAWTASPTPIAGFDLAPKNEVKFKDSLKTVSNPKGRFAVATVIAKLGSVRNDAPKGSAEDLMPCSILLHYLSFREYGGFSADEPVDYVLIHYGIEQSIVDQWRRFGIKTVAKDHVSLKLWDPFQAGSLFKLHAVGLTEYSRVLVIDNDMYIASSLRNAFLADYDEDFVTQAVGGSPLTGNFMNLRPSADAYELLLDLASNKKFDWGRGWNPDDPRSGLFVWPAREEIAGTMICEMPFPLIKNGADCSVPNEFYSRCAATWATTWSWVAAAWDQGIFLYVFNVSGLGSTRWVKFGAVHQGEVESGQPYFFHYQGHCKPHIIVAKNLDKPLPPDCIGMDLTVWFWNSLWKVAREKYKLDATCPSFEKYDQVRNKTKPSTR